jgi:hypothetical protein
MKTKKQHAKFFCENCGTEVPENARVCRNCGRFFSSVRCPKCGASGQASLFDKGCPVCGYAVNNTGTVSYTAGFEGKTKRRLSAAEKKKIAGAFRFRQESTRSGVHGDNSLPVWIYVITVCILAAVLAAVFSCIK